MKVSERKARLELRLVIKRIINSTDGRDARFWRFRDEQM